MKPRRRGRFHECRLAEFEEKSRADDRDRNLRVSARRALVTGSCNACINPIKYFARRSILVCKRKTCLPHRKYPFHIKIILEEKLPKQSSARIVSSVLRNEIDPLRAKNTRFPGLTDTHCHEINYLLFRIQQSTRQNSLLFEVWHVPRAICMSIVQNNPVRELACVSGTVDMGHPVVKPPVVKLRGIVLFEYTQMCPMDHVVCQYFVVPLLTRWTNNPKVSWRKTA